MKGIRDIRDKNVVITGAGSGIGRALALRCAGLGAHLAICDVDGEGLTAVRKELDQFGVRVFAAQVDVADEGEVARFAVDVCQALGDPDVLINNAGVSLIANIEQMPLAELERVMNVNFWGVVHGCHAFLPALRRRDAAHIVNVSSVFGLQAVPGQAAYNASKFAVRGYTEALRLELADSCIGVSCVHPGGVRTNIVRYGRFVETPGKASETAEARAAHFARLARTSPEDAARAILAGILRRRPRVLIGGDARFMDIMQRLAPVAAGSFVRFMVRRDEEKRHVAAPRDQ